MNDSKQRKSWQGFGSLSCNATVITVWSSPGVWADQTIPPDTTSYFSVLATSLRN
jgi:hypothetical protein